MTLKDVASTAVDEPVDDAPSLTAKTPIDITDIRDADVSYDAPVTPVPGAVPRPGDSPQRGESAGGTAKYAPAGTSDRTRPSQSDTVRGGATGLALSSPAGRIGDRVFRALAAGSGAIVLATMAAIAVFLIIRAWPAVTANTGNLLTTQVWRPQSDPPVFGMAAILFGTVVSSLIAIAVGVPIAVGVALAISHYLRQRWASALGGLIDLLAAVPSLVFGMWGLYFLIPHTRGFQQWLSNYFGWIPFLHNETATVAGQYGQSLLMAGIVLAIMIIPIVASVCREVFARTPQTTIDAALALGATRWDVIRTAVLPFGRSGMVAAAMLGLGRALGETIAVALVLGSGFAINWHLTEQGGDTVASTIVLKFGEAGSDSVGIPALILAGLVLFAITLVVNATARFVMTRKSVTV
jgi:phosphate transport system permease protein